MIVYLNPSEFAVILQVFAAHVDTLTEDQLAVMSFEPMEIVRELQDEDIASITIYIKECA